MSEFGPFFGRIKGNIICFRDLLTFRNYYSSFDELCSKFYFFYFSGPIVPHTIVTLPNSNGMQLLLCYDNEGVYVNTYGKVSKNIVLQWGELPTSVAYIGTGQIMGWGNKAIEIRSIESGHLDGVFMHKKAQKLKFLCERNDKVFFSSAKVSFSSCQRNLIKTFQIALIT